MRLIYPLLIQLYGLAILLVSAFKPKAKQFIEGRKNQGKFLAHLPESGTKRVLWHCASLGEYEQARPLIEVYHKKYPTTEIWLSFFSPSGYENAEIDTWISGKLYLPLDIKARQAKFLDLLKPAEIYLIKYEIWPVLIRLCAQKKITIRLVCANFRKEQIYFKWYGAYFRKALQRIVHIYVQYNASQELLAIYPTKQISIIGDARFDKALQNETQKTSITKIEHFIGNAPVLVLGSSWPAEHKLLKKALENKLLNNWKIIIAPHNVDTTSINRVLTIFPEANLFSNNFEDTQILVLNQIGLLKNVYQYATLAFIGGGFTGKLHNTIEAAAFGCPIAFGPKHQKFPEAAIFIKEGIACTISTPDNLINCAKESVVSNKTELKKAFTRHTGCAQKFVDLI